MKTIKMSKELGEKWLAALRSGEYKQGKGSLFRYGQYCCLGVLEEVAGELEEGNGFPSRTWLDIHKVTFFSYGKGQATDPYLKQIDATAAEANDEGFSFSKIADAIEEAMEYIEEPLA